MRREKPICHAKRLGKQKVSRGALSSLISSTRVTLNPHQCLWQLRLQTLSHIPTQMHHFSWSQLCDDKNKSVWAFAYRMLHSFRSLIASCFMLAPFQPKKLARQAGQKSKGAGHFSTKFHLQYGNDDHLNLLKHMTWHICKEKHLWPCNELCAESLWMLLRTAILKWTNTLKQWMPTAFWRKICLHNVVSSLII